MSCPAGMTYAEHIAYNAWRRSASPEELRAEDLRGATETEGIRPGTTGHELRADHPHRCDAYRNHADELRAEFARLRASGDPRAHQAADALELGFTQEYN